MALLMLHEEARAHLDIAVAACFLELREQQLLIPGATSFDQTVRSKMNAAIHQLRSFPCLWGLDKMVRKVAKVPLEFEHCTRWQYGAGSSIVGAVG